MKKIAVAPKARQRALIVKELAGETLVYDEHNHRAHCLNQTAALVWKFCDGRTSIPAIAKLLEKEVSVSVPEPLVWLAIKQLEDSRLLDAAARPSATLPQRSRRELMRRIGVGAIALPIITSLLAPAAAQAATCRTLNQSCIGGPGQGTCCAGLSCSTGLNVCQNN